MSLRFNLFMLAEVVSQAVSQTAAAALSDYAPALSMLGSLGFAVWYAWYVTTVALPKMHDAHRAERAEMRVDFAAALAQEREEFAKAISGLLAELKETRAALQQALMARTS